MLGFCRVGVYNRVFFFATVIGLLVCTTVASAAKKPRNEDCLACHNDASLTKDVDGKQVSLQVDPKHFKDSVHGGMFACVDCHKGVKAEPHETTPEKVGCDGCHAEQQAAYGRSFHAKSPGPGKANAATCQDCHGNIHEVLPVSDPKSPVNHANIPVTCGQCHGQRFVMEPVGQSAQPYMSYQESVHGRALAAGKDGAAVCTDCHGSHDILPASNHESPIFKFNVPQTCGKCHQGVAKDFVQSIHGQALARGNDQAPVCTDCHGIHTIKTHLDPTSPVSALNLAKATCARCHEGVRLSQEFGTQSHAVATYLDSYHGLASRGGSQVAANCASCHGVHNILPSSDPRSKVSKENLAKTCGACHPGVNERFALTRVHVDSRTSGDIGSIAVRWIRRFYIFLILAVIGAMLLHNVIIWRAKAIARRKAEGASITRMSVNQRWQHFLLFTSFIVLVVTGFALKYPDSWFADLLHMSERVRSIVHRVAGVVMIGAGIYHLFYLALSSSGRKLLRDFFPKGKDAFDVFGAMRYYLGFSRTKPEFDRFNYAEKAEYWALVWGIIIMATTGIMLWFKVLVGDLLARWWIDVATAIHFYEAVLATLAIIVWHFYQVFFDPDVYPMNWAWWDGKMSEKHYREEHGLDATTLAPADAVDTAAASADNEEESLKS